jgi:hypothetical protein
MRILLPAAEPGDPDTRSPLRLLVWVGRRQLATLAAGVGFGIFWMVAQALMPFAIGPTMRSRSGRRSCSASASCRRSPA